jgi:hypothetical protein
MSRPNTLAKTILTPAETAKVRDYLTLALDQVESGVVDAIGIKNLVLCQRAALRLTHPKMYATEARRGRSAGRE